MDANYYLCRFIHLNNHDMQIVTARQFRSNQGKYLTAARCGSSILLTSRYGNFKITPVTDEDEIIERDLRVSLQEVKDHLDGKIDLPSAKDLIF